MTEPTIGTALMYSSTREPEITCPDGRRILYNLTCHNQAELATIPQIAVRWSVEIKSRLSIVNPSDWSEIKQVVRVAVMDIPPGSDVIVGGLAQIHSLLVELGRFNLFYVRMVRDGSARSRPVGLIPHRGWTRAEKFQIERAGPQLKHP